MSYECDWISEFNFTLSAKHLLAVLRYHSESSFVLIIWFFTNIFPPCWLIIFDVIYINSYFGRFIQRCRSFQRFPATWILEGVLSGMYRCLTIQKLTSWNGRFIVSLLCWPDCSRKIILNVNWVRSKHTVSKFVVLRPSKRVSVDDHTRVFAVGFLSLQTC
jgi:hypothetical protein